MQKVETTLTNFNEESLECNQLASIKIPIDRILNKRHFS